MRKATLVVALGMAFASYALPQEAASGKEAQTEQSDPWIWWKWANFLILAAGLGYLINKNVPPLFRKESEEIQKALAESAKIKEEAAAYAASVEARLANLQSEIQKLRENAHSEMTAESERIRRETEHHVQRIKEQSAQEIDLTTRAAKAELMRPPPPTGLTHYDHIRAVGECRNCRTHSVLIPDKCNRRMPPS